MLTKVDEYKNMATHNIAQDEIKQRNILFLELSTGFGGSSRCLFQWLRYLNKELFHPVVITYFDGIIHKKIKSLGTEVLKIPYLCFMFKIIQSYKGGTLLTYLLFLIDILVNIFPVLFRLIFLIKKMKIDLIVFNANITASIPGILASKITKIPCICHIHEIRRLTKKEKFFGQWVDKFIVLTNEATKLYRTNLGEEKLSVIYNGLNLNDYESIRVDTIKEEFNLKEGDSIIGIVGRLTEGKGHIDFIRAAKKIHDQNPKVKFFIVGSAVLVDKKIEQQLKSLVQKLELDKCVIFTGWRDDIMQIMANLNILVFPSSTFPEGFGLACIEAMALNKPVVATNIPGPSEIVLDGITGFLVPPANPDVLAEKIIKLINNPDLAKGMGIAGKKRVEELFNIKKLTKQIENIYNEVLCGRRKKHV